MSEIVTPGRRLTADVTHKIRPMITVKDADGKEWFARAMFLDLNRGVGNDWSVDGVSLSIAAKPTHAFYKNTKLGVDIGLDQNPGLKELVDKYIGVVTDDTARFEG